MSLRRGGRGQHGGKDMSSNWRNRPRPIGKSMEQGRSYNRQTGKAIEGETVAARPVVAGKRGNARAILCHRPLECLFLLHPILGRKEDPAPSGSGVSASRFRLEAVAQGMAVRNAGTLFGVPRHLWAVDLGSRSGRTGLITLVANCAGARSAGNPHATCDVAGAGIQLTDRIVRHSQRKRGATDRPDLQSNSASPRPYRVTFMLHLRWWAVMGPVKGLPPAQPSWVSTAPVFVR
jgi:hypothetical protein